MYNMDCSTKDFFKMNMEIVHIPHRPTLVPHKMVAIARVHQAGIRDVVVDTPEPLQCIAGLDELPVLRLCTHCHSNPIAFGHFSLITITNLSIYIDTY